MEENKWTWEQLKAFNYQIFDDLHGDIRQRYEWLKRHSKSLYSKSEYHDNLGNYDVANDYKQRAIGVDTAIKQFQNLFILSDQKISLPEPLSTDNDGRDKA